MLSKVYEIENLNKNSAEYRKQCYEIASINSYFEMPFPTIEANKLREDYEHSEFFKRNIRNQQAPLLFYKNETKNNIDIKEIFKNIKNRDVKLFAIYGQQDKIFSSKQLSNIKEIVTKQNFKIIDNFSHYLFVDQQQVFIESIEKWIK